MLHCLLVSQRSSCDAVHCGHAPRFCLLQMFRTAGELAYAAGCPQDGVWSTNDSAPRLVSSRTAVVTGQPGCGWCSWCGFVPTCHSGAAAEVVGGITIHATWCPAGLACHQVPCRRHPAVVDIPLCWRCIHDGLAAGALGLHLWRFHTCLQPLGRLPRPCSIADRPGPAAAWPRAPVGGPTGSRMGAGASPRAARDVWAMQLRH